MGIFDQLDDADRSTVLAFAAFLQQRSNTPVPPKEVPPIKLIPRPEHESVVGGIKRLTQSYFMIDKDALMDETSLLMTQHVLKGRPAADVINDLEQMFAHHYQQIKDSENV